MHNITTEAKFGKFGHPPVTFIYRTYVEYYDEDDQVPHRTEFPAKGDDRSDDRCEPYRLQQHDNGLQDTFQKDQGTPVGIRYEQDRYEDETQLPVHIKGILPYTERDCGTCHQGLREDTRYPQEGIR